jgi:membrane-bound lytic murein transglycosylase D
MIRCARTSKSLLLLAVVVALNAGCAQTSGTYIAADTSPVDWPTPKVDNTPPPVPREPTPVPLVTAPPGPTATPTEVAPRRAVTPSRTAAASTSAPTAAPRAAVTQAAAASAPRDVWERVRNGFQMRPLNSGLVGDWENYYASRPDYFAQMINNSSHFLFHITAEVERRGMPLEIALLPMIESAYNPVAYSHAHASGIWQFIPSTGKNYGLKQNWWYDGRRDVIAATSAALDYLQTLYGMFNDWELALASYNWGEGAVQRAVERNQAKGLPADYSSLEHMPAETRNYLPKLMAVKNIIANPGRFGLTLAHVPNEPYFEVVTVRRHIDVTRAAQFADMSLDDFKFLNPAHNKRVINSDSAETIVLPRHKVAAFRANMNRHEHQPLVSMKTHTVRAGERPEAIAEQYGISVGELNQMNNIGGRRRA